MTEYDEGGGCQPNITDHEKCDKMTNATEKLCGAAGAKKKKKSQK